jgi:hypothetical protein
MAERAHLHVVVNPDTGEIVEPDCEGCRTKNDEIAGLERDVRGWAVRYAELKRDRDAEAREHPMWPVGERVFREWRQLCRHPRSPWTQDRFWQIEPFLTNPKYGKEEEARVALCRRAVAGAAYDAYKTTRRNGSVKHHNDWDLIFRSADKFEEFCNRAPTGWAA